ncbi:MAG: 50S ribosomal protein L25/general stress protein Ctc, partial [Tardiphaga sp.]|nr:50S ribosomal protein L25/general stress protein Ctc [Tardiphaga sp.]
DLDGTKHRVIPRDFALDPVRDFPLHVDFLRLGVGATIRVSVPLHLKNADSAPGVKRGGTINVVTHTLDVEAEADSIPQFIEADVSQLDIGGSLHMSDIKLPKGVKALARDEDVTLVTIVPPSGYGEEGAAATPGATAAPAAAAAAKAPAAGAKAPAPGAKAPAAGAKAPAAPAKKK